MLISKIFLISVCLVFANANLNARTDDRNSIENLYRENRLALQNRVNEQRNDRNLERMNDLHIGSERIGNEVRSEVRSETRNVRDDWESRSEDRQLERLNNDHESRNIRNEKSENHREVRNEQSNRYRRNLGNEFEENRRIFERKSNSNERELTDSNRLSDDRTARLEARLEDRQIGSERIESRETERRRETESRRETERRLESRLNNEREMNLRYEERNNERQEERERRSSDRLERTESRDDRLNKRDNLSESRQESSRNNENKVDERFERSNEKMERIDDQLENRIRSTQDQRLEMREDQEINANRREMRMDRQNTMINRAGSDYRLESRSHLNEKSFLTFDYSTLLFTAITSYLTLAIPKKQVSNYLNQFKQLAF